MILGVHIFVTADKSLSDFSMALVGHSLKAEQGANGTLQALPKQYPRCAAPVRRWITLSTTPS